jgi:membrane protein
LNVNKTKVSGSLAYRKIRKWPVMKAEAEPHHEHGHPLTPVVEEERAEAGLGRKVEKLAEHPRAAESHPQPEAEAQVEGDGARSPAPVGKPGARSDTDDLR